MPVKFIFILLNIRKFFYIHCCLIPVSRFILLFFFFINGRVCRGCCSAGVLFMRLYAVCSHRFSNQGHTSQPNLHEMISTSCLIKHSVREPIPIPIGNKPTRTEPSIKLRQLDLPTKNHCLFMSEIVSVRVW